MIGATMPSRPLRAFWVVIGLWVSGRAIAIWQEVPRVSAVPTRRLAVGLQNLGERKAVEPVIPIALSTKPVMSKTAGIKFALPDRLIYRPLPATSAIAAPPPVELRSTAFSPNVWVEPPTAPAGLSAMSLSSGRSLSSATTGHRWSASTWLLVRDGGSSGFATGGELGGSQAGGRLNFALTPAVFATTRLSAPLQTRGGREGAVGIGIRGRSVGLIVEERFSLDGLTPARPAVTVYGGFSEVGLPARFRLDGYGQGGVVGRDGFVDGALRVEHTLLERARTRLSLGAGFWGAAQPTVSRLDVGPQLVARLPLADRAVRLSLEWRERIAGNAIPARGPAVTLGADF